MNNNPNKKQSLSQKTRILNYLKSGKSLTSLEALSLFQSLGGFRTRISELKAEGNDIRKEMIRVESGKHIARYWLKEEICGI